MLGWLVIGRAAHAGGGSGRRRTRGSSSACFACRKVQSATAKDSLATQKLLLSDLSDNHDVKLGWINIIIRPQRCQ